MLTTLKAGVPLAQPSRSAQTPQMVTPHMATPHVVTPQVAMTQVARRVALQLSGHLRETCDIAANFAVLEETVLSCRRHAQCDLFLHTWDTLQASTPSWHRPNASADPPRPSSECAGRIATQLNVTNLQVEAQASVGRFSNATWYTAKMGDSHISLAGIAAAVETQQKANDLRRAHELQGHRYDVVVRLRPDLYRAEHPEVASWALIAQALHSLPDTIFSCRAMRWPGKKGADMCFLAFSPSAFNRLYGTWGAAANAHLSAMECAWKARRAQLICPATSELQTAPGCKGLLGAASCAKPVGHEYPENILGVTLVRAHLQGRSWATLPHAPPMTSSPTGSLGPAYICHRQTGAPGACLRKYTPCTMSAVTQQQCELLCEATDACRFYAFDSQQRCTLTASRGNVHQEQSKSGKLLCAKLRSHPTLANASSDHPPPPPLPLALPANTGELPSPLHRPFEEDQQSSHTLPLLALANPSHMGHYDGVRNGWSGWWLRLTSACDHFNAPGGSSASNHPAARLCTLWLADAALLPAPRCPVNCRLAPRPNAAVLEAADAVLMRSASDETLVLNVSGVGELAGSPPGAPPITPPVHYCIESEAGTWRQPQCPPSVLAVSTRPEAALRFSWLSRLV